MSSYNEYDWSLLDLLVLSLGVTGKVNLLFSGLSHGGR